MKKKRPAKSNFTKNSEPTTAAHPLVAPYDTTKGAPSLSLFGNSPYSPLFHYSLILLTTLYCHWLILTNNGLISDAWWLNNFIETKNWLALHDNFRGTGMPLLGFTYRIFAYLWQPVPIIMSCTFIAITLAGCITYNLLQKTLNLSTHENIILTLLAQTLPLYSNAQEIITFPFIAAHTLFLGSALSFAISFQKQGTTRILLRIFGTLGFHFSFGYAALLVYYGFFYLLLFYRHTDLFKYNFVKGTKAFLIRYPELLLLPPCTWVLRSLMNPNNWWLENYNSPAANLKTLIPNLLSFFKNVLPYHITRLVEWPIHHPILTIITGALLALIIRYNPERWALSRSHISSFTLFGIGSIALFFSIFGFAAAGKYFPEIPTGTSSSYCMFAGLPCAILVFSVLRSSFLVNATRGLALPVVATFLILISGSEFFSVYLKERVEFIFSKALLHNASNNQDVRNSSVVLIQNFTAVKQPSYGTYAFASEFGELSRYISANGPENKQFYTPSEISRIVKLTTFPPDDFRNVNPAGQQIYGEGVRHQENLTDWQLAYQYFKLSFFGNQQDLHSFLEPLVTLKTTIIRPAMPFVPGSASTELATQPTTNTAPQNDFIASQGIQMKRMIEGWWVSRYETTQAQYESVMGTNPSLFKAPQHPVERVSWYEAMEFCKRLTDLEKNAGRLPSGMVYRLPTVQEFNLLLSGGAAQNPVISVNEPRWQTAPIGSTKADQLGLHDLVGNVWEWCLDWSDKTHLFKVSKGGSWNNLPWEILPYSGPIDKNAGTSMKAAIKILVGPARKDFPNSRFWEHGFRCILAPPTSEPDVQPATP